MEKIIETEHTDMTIGELCHTIEEGHRPIRRSPHIGNIQPKDLAVMAGLPEGVEVLMVHTIQGDDKITRPHVVQLSHDREIKLASRGSATGRVVGAVAIKLMDESAHMLPVVPDMGRSIASYHAEALGRLQLRNQPVNMMERFNQHPELLMATIEACKEQGSLHRLVGEGGKIRIGNQVDIRKEGVYGVDDSTPSERGALLPLTGMMVMDMLLSEEAGSDETLHLGGGDMACYTRDEQRMEAVNIVKLRAAAHLGRCSIRHRYIVQDCRGLAAMVPEVSQHELLTSGRTIDPTEHLLQPCGGNDEK